MNCCDCKDLKDQFGNFVFCPFLKRFVDWEYWNNTIPDDCPKKKDNVQEYIIKEIIDAGLYNQDGEKVIDLTNTCIKELKGMIIKKKENKEL